MERTLAPPQGSNVGSNFNNINNNPPQVPPDDDTRNIIDRLAEFVAKNGSEFEERTRKKQYGNPRFAFLFGGEFSDYYRFRVMQEVQQLNQGTVPPSQAIQPSASSVHQFDASAVLAQINTLNQQIADSEANLRAQFESIEVRREAQLAAAIEESETKKILSVCEQVSLNVEPLSKLLDQLSGHCSKDVISNSKKWIFEHCTTDRLREAILMYLLYRVKETRATEQFKLHILYLINDWAHHCQRKKLDAIRQMLSRYVPQLYAFTAQGVKDAALNEKLEKLIGVWEGHKYFDDGCYKQLRNPLLLYQNWKNAQQAEYSKKSAEIHAQLLAAYRGYEQQHLEFSMHCRNQIALLQQQIDEQMNKQVGASSCSEVILKPPMNRRERRSRFDQKVAGPPPELPPESDYGRFFAAPPSGSSKCPSPRDIYHARPDECDEPPFALYNEREFPNENRNEPGPKDAMFNLRPPFPGGPTMMRPPCGPPPIFDESALIPSCPYYNLPAGMMMPLIEMGDVLYKPVIVSKLRLPPPIPPSERLLRAIEAFYAPPSFENPRDADGWERLGLFEYYMKKNDIKKRLEESLKLEGKTIEDAIENIYIEDNDEEKNDEKIRRSTSRRSSTSSRSKSSSSSSSSRSRRRRRRKRSHSISNSGSSSSSSSRGRRRSRRSKSPSPRRRRRSSSRSASPESRPAFGGSSRRDSRSPTPKFLLPSGPPPRLNAANKGAQLLAKMGWQGGGLGSEHQGIKEPISGGEVRDHVDQYRGVGSKPDMYEEYRKQMSGYHRNRNRRFD